MNKATFPRAKRFENSNPTLLKIWEVKYNITNEEVSSFSFIMLKILTHIQKNNFLKAAGSIQFLKHFLHKRYCLTIV